MRKKTMRLIAAVIVLLMLSVTVSVATVTPSEPEPTPDATQLAAMRNEAALSPGLAAIYREQYPDYSDYICGETDTVTAAPRQ